MFSRVRIEQPSVLQRMGGLHVEQACPCTRRSGAHSLGIDLSSVQLVDSFLRIFYLALLGEITDNR